LTVIVVIASLAAVGTYAGFIDTETSHNNLWKLDPFDLIVENPQDIGETWGHSVLRTWHYENTFGSEAMEPGDVLTSYVNLKSFGDSPGHHINIYCVNVNEEPDWDTDAENEAEAAILGESVTDMPGYGIYDKDKVMIITSMTYHVTPLIWGEYNSYNHKIFKDTDGDGRISLDEFEAQNLRDLTPVPNSGAITFSMTVKFATTTLRNGEIVAVGNEYQGDRTMMTLIFALMD
jgi:hypothetical protein